MIKVPFISKSIECIQLSEKNIRCIKLTKILGKVRIKKVDSVVIDNSWQESLQRLITKSKFESENLAILLPYKDFTNLVLDDPDIEDNEELIEWIEDYINHYTDINLSMIRYNYIFFGEIEKKILISYIHCESIDNYNDTFAKHGLKPQYICSYIDALRYSLLLNEDQFKQNSLFILKGEKIQLIRFRKGVLVDYQEIEKKSFNLKKMISIEDYKTEIKGDSTSNINIWEVDRDECFQTSFDEKKPNERFLLGYYKSTLQFEYLPIVGQLNSLIFNLPANFNFISQKSALDSRLSYLKKNTALLAKIALSFFLLLYLLVRTTSFFLENHSDRVAAELAVINEKVELLEQKQNKLVELKSIWKNTSKISSDSTYFTGFVNEISSGIPKSLWLSDVRISREDQNYIILVNGYTTNQSNVAKLLKNFEKSNFFEKIELDFIDVASDRIVKEYNITSGNKLFEFKVTLRN